MQNEQSLPISKITKFEWLLLIIAWSMFWGFMFSRALGSISMMVLFAISLHPKNIKYHWQVFKENRFAWLALFFFLAYFISGLWSTNISQWIIEVRIKLPFLIFPFAFIVLPFANIHFRKIFIQGLLILFSIGMIYSLYFMVNNWGNFLAGKHFYGPLDGDYLRFSIGLILSVNLAFYLLFEAQKFNLNRLIKNLLIAYIAFSTIYIHLQSSKLGLLALYALFLFYLLFMIHKKIGKQKTILLFSGILLFGVLSGYFLPSFNTQLNKVQRELSLWKEQDPSKYIGVSSIIPRIISYQAGYELIKENPIGGVGAGDLKMEMEKVYEDKFPFMRSVLVPHNQYIYSLATIGIPMSIFLILMIIYPLWRGSLIYEKAVVVVMVCATMIEAMFEVQHGVFVYLFFTLFWIAVRREKPLVSE